MFRDRCASHPPAGFHRNPDRAGGAVRQPGVARPSSSCRGRDYRRHPAVSGVPMPLASTPAIVLSALRYSETSKIVRLATRDLGVQSAIAKGALRPKSRFGGALQLLSEGQAQYLAKEHRELHLLTAFDLGHLHVGLAADLARYATAAALAEVMIHF